MRRKPLSVKQSRLGWGVPVAEVIRKAGISEQTFYRWKAIGASPPLLPQNW
jgi:putative transposase